MISTTALMLPRRVLYYLLFDCIGVKTLPSDDSHNDITDDCTTYNILLPMYVSTIVINTFCSHTHLAAKSYVANVKFEPYNRHMGMPSRGSGSMPPVRS